jgi:hypothetical protein
MGIWETMIECVNGKPTGTVRDSFGSHEAFACTDYDHGFVAVTKKTEDYESNSRPKKTYTTAKVEDTGAGWNREIAEELRKGVHEKQTQDDQAR